MKSPDLKTIRKRAKAATKGPWSHYHAPLRAQYRTHVHEIRGANGKPVVHWSGFDQVRRPKRQVEADAAFIAVADPPTVLALLDRIRVPENALEDALETIDGHFDDNCEFCRDTIAHIDSVLAKSNGR